jgi:hypothetical protein
VRATPSLWAGRASSLGVSAAALDYPTAAAQGSQCVRAKQRRWRESCGRSDGVRLMLQRVQRELVERQARDRQEQRLRHAQSLAHIGRTRSTPEHADRGGAQ